MAHDGIESCEVPGSYPDGGEADAYVDGDRDQDTVVDSIDNCPDVANTNQADDDGDGTGDVCDPCPPFADNSDGDGDGVGNACDPNPATAGDTLVAFEGFTGALPTTWTSSGTAMINSGEMSLLAGDSATSLLTMPSPSAARVEVRASVVIDLITASGLNLGSVNLIDRLEPNTDKSVACQLAGLADGTQELLRVFDASTATEINSAAHALTPGDPIELRLRRSGTSYACYASDPSLEVVGSAAFLPAAPRIGLRVRGAAARFRWVMVVTSP
ncbi:MAG TPA: hypothetical protein VFV99_23385 [Kofleriaceae bacterium]|nr:hypothetical protein [Kofleriaceae bacterium]